MNIYAPPSDNNPTKEYVNFIAKKLNVTPDTPINKIDTNAWAKAITQFESPKLFKKLFDNSLVETEKKQTSKPEAGYGVLSIVNSKDKNSAIDFFNPNVQSKTKDGKPVTKTQEEEVIKELKASTKPISEEKEPTKKIDLAISKVKNDAVVNIMKPLPNISGINKNIPIKKVEKDAEIASKSLMDEVLGKLETISVSDIMEFGSGWLHKKGMEIIPWLEDNGTAIKKIESVKEVYVPPVKTKEAETKFNDVFNEIEGYKGKTIMDGKKEAYSIKAGGSYHSFRNAFDNDKGYNYTAIPNVGNHVDSTYSSPGVAHFLLDADISQKDNYKHDYSKSMINRQLKGDNIQNGSTVETQYFPIMTKQGNKVNIKYKSKDEFVEGDKENITSPLRQYRYSDFDWNAKGVFTQAFNETVLSIPVKNSFMVKKRNSKEKVKTNESHLVYSKVAGKGQYGDFSGTAIVFIVNKNGKRLIIDYANSVENIQTEAQNIIKKYNIKPEDLIMGMHDLGSFNAKPVGKNGKLKYHPKTFNDNSHTGGALAF